MTVAVVAAAKAAAEEVRAAEEVASLRRTTP